MKGWRCVSVHRCLCMFVFMHMLIELYVYFSIFLMSISREIIWIFLTVWGCLHYISAITTVKGCLIVNKDQNQQWIDHNNTIISIVLCAIELHCCLLKTHHWATLLYWVTCFFITMNTNTVVYFESFPHPAVRNTHCQMCVNPPMKIVPNKCTIYSCLSKEITKTF